MLKDFKSLSDAEIQKMHDREEIKFHEMLDAMQRGGSFVRALAECFRHADINNRKRLMRAFPDYVEEYSKGGKFNDHAQS